MLVIVGVGVVLVAGFLVLVVTRPNTYRVQRRAIMRAEAGKIFGEINDLRRWSSWSPYEKLDPAMKRVFEGAETGKGSVYQWEGNSKIGAGRMEIVESVEPERVSIRLKFLRPMPGQSLAEFTLAPKDGATEVTWSMTGPVPFVGKILHLCFNMDRMIGNSFESGLADLKAQVEK